MDYRQVRSCWSGKVDIRFGSVGKHGWVVWGSKEVCLLLLPGWHKCDLEPIEAYFSMIVWHTMGSVTDRATWTLARERLAIWRDERSVRQEIL